MYNPTFLNHVTSILMILTVQALISSSGIPTHLVQPLEVGLIMMGCLVEKLSPWLAGAEMIRLRVFLLGHKDLSLSLDLVILHPFVFFYPIHQLLHILRRLHNKGLS